LVVGTSINFSLLSGENRLKWLKFFSQTVVQLNRECKLLQGQLDEYRTTTATNVNSEAKVNFVDSVSPTIKNAMFGIFIRLIFASQVEVTTSKDRRALVSFGLTEKCGVASLVFDSIFKSEEGTASKPVTVVGDADMSAATPHPLNTPEMRESLWFDFGLGPFSLKQFNTTRNTYTSMIREVTSKSSLQILTPSLCIMHYISHYYCVL
jgi:hypothetical protein